MYHGCTTEVPRETRIERPQMARRHFGSIEELPSGQFRAFFPDPRPEFRGTRKRVYSPVTFDKKTPAHRWLDNQKSAIDNGTWKHPEELAEEQRLAAEREREAAITFAQYAVPLVDGLELRTSTRKSYESYLHNHLLPKWGSTPLRDITTARVRQWVTIPRQRSSKVPDPSKLAPFASTKTRSNVAALFKMIMATAVEDGIITRNPCPRAMIHKGEPSTRQPYALTMGQLARLADEVPDYMRALVLTAGLCALRSGEARELRRRDLHLDEGYLDVERGVIGHGSSIEIGPPKTAAGIRSITVPDTLVPVIEEHLRRFADIGPDALVFPSRNDPAVHMPERTLQLAIARSAERAGLPETTPHDLRHTGLTLAARAGATTADLQARAGHTTPNMAMRYQHTTIEAQRRIAQALAVEMTTPETAPNNVVPIERKAN